MWEDPIVEEVRKIREEHAARFGYDLAAICKDLREEQAHSGRKVVRLAPRRPQPVPFTSEDTSVASILEDRP
jgi:hypothetical protein